MADRYRIQRHRGGRFTAYEWDDGRWEIDRPGRNERFSLSRDGQSFFITERDDGRTTREVYRDTNRDGIFEYRRTDAVGQTSRPREGSLRVDPLTGGRFQVYEWDDGRWRLERPDRNERFRLSRDRSTFTRLEFERNGTEINVYSDSNGDGVYEFVRSRFEPASSRSNAQIGTSEPDFNAILLGSQSLI